MTTLDVRTRTTDPERASPAVSELAGKRVVIFGIGHFGGQIEAARHMCRAGARVLATDLKDKGKLGPALEALAGLPVELRLGAHRAEDFLGADLVIVSPAVPKSSPFMRLLVERGIPWTTELNLTLARVRAPVYAVTGSNGKSTTTTLLGRALEAAGFTTFVGGNIGRPLLNEVDRIGPAARVVLEISSFQLEDLKLAGQRFAPDLALVTNVTPNHLDRHGTLEAYAAAKRQLLESQGSEHLAILGREDPIVHGFRTATRARVFTFGLEDDDGSGAFVRAGVILGRDEDGREHRFGDVAAIRMPGRHNLLNALATAAAATALRLPEDPAGRAIAEFEGLRDRLEVVRLRREVRFVNDSKATTPEAAIAGIEAFEPGVTLIAGGSDKGMDFRPLARAAAERAARVFLIGATRERLRDEILAEARAALGPAVILCETLEDAVGLAADHAEPGSTVLFSPACASYDMFTSFEERGERFRAAVRSLEA